ncbi:DNA-binding protein [Kiritimatiellota bacterium B12222]|nr:DNA-binding protein [Kiritimatiellota bacterium B12222]
MKQLLVRNVEESLVKKLKIRAAENGVSAEEYHRRLLAESLNRPQEVREPLACYLVNHPILEELELPLSRSSDPENRETGL